jgi:hypothetical protein
LQECIQVIADALIQAVEFAAYPFCHTRSSRKGRIRATVKTRIDVLEQFEEGYANRAAFADQPVARDYRIRSTKPSTRISSSGTTLAPILFT